MNILVPEQPGPPPTMLDVLADPGGEGARLRSCAPSGTRGPTSSAPNLFLYEP